MHELSLLKVGSDIDWSSEVKTLSLGISNNNTEARIVIKKLGERCRGSIATGP